MISINWSFGFFLICGCVRGIGSNGIFCTFGSLTKSQLLVTSCVWVWALKVIYSLIISLWLDKDINFLENFHTIPLWGVLFEIYFACINKIQYFPNHVESASLQSLSSIRCCDSQAQLAALRFLPQVIHWLGLPGIDVMELKEDLLTCFLFNGTIMDISCGTTYYKKKYLCLSIHLHIF